MSQPNYNKPGALERSMNLHEHNPKKLPIGIEDFEKLRKNEFYYVDKTGLIRDLLQSPAEVMRFTRPRPFQIAGREDKKIGFLQQFGADVTPSGKAPWTKNNHPH